MPLSARASLSDTHKNQRMVHYHDIVPHYPFLDLGYHHVAREIWEITNSTEHKYIVCDGMLVCVASLLTRCRVGGGP